MTRTASNKINNQKNAPSSPGPNKAIKKQRQSNPRPKKSASPPQTPEFLKFNDQGVIFVPNIRPGKAVFQEYTSNRKLTIPLRGFKNWVNIQKTINCELAHLNIWTSVSEKPTDERLVLNVTAPEISSSNPHKGEAKRKAAIIELLTETNAVVLVELEFDSTYHKANPKYVIDVTSLFFNAPTSSEPASLETAVVAELAVEYCSDVILQDDEVTLAVPQESEPVSVPLAVEVDPSFNPDSFLNTEQELGYSSEDQLVLASSEDELSLASSEDGLSLTSSEDGLILTSDDEITNLFSAFTAEQQSTSSLFEDFDFFGNTSCYGSWQAPIGI